MGFGNVGGLEDRTGAAPGRARGQVSTPLDRLSWDSLRLLLAIAESGSFRAAAIVAGVALNTIRSKLDRLERQFGTQLLRRSVEGVRLTQQGHELVSIARQMRSVGENAERVRRPVADHDHDVLRVAATEGLGTFWLIPRLGDLRRDHADLRVQMTCDMTPTDVLFRDVDVAVQLGRPTNPDLIVERLATLHVMPFAAESYLRDHGSPTSLADAPGHTLVSQGRDQLAPDALAFLLSASAAHVTVAVQTNTSPAQYLAIARGAGIGLLPTYVAALDPAICALDIGVRLRRELYLVHHRDAAGFPRVRAAIAWLRDAFDADQYPWFADGFVHPDAFPRGSGGSQLTAPLGQMVPA